MSDQLSTAEAPPVGKEPPAPARPWYRRRWALVTAGAILVLAVAVVTDLPSHSSQASDRVSDVAAMKEINTDIGGCSYAVKEALAIRRAQLDHSISAADARQLPALLRDDQSACSLTSENIFDLSNIEVPSSPSGRYINELVGTAQTWTTSDALAVIEDVQSLVSNPNDTVAASRLAHYEKVLEADRVVAEQQLASARRAVHASLPAVDLVRVTPPTGSTG